MRTEPPPILPLFRSAGQARLLERLFLDDTPATLADLARELDLDRGAVSREADRLEAAGIVRSERIGRQRLLRPDDSSPYFDDLRGLIVKAFGPVALLAEALSTIGGVEQASVFGSWAARRLGLSDARPHDIDVLVVGTARRRELSRACSAVQRQIGVEVSPVLVSGADWAAQASPLLRAIADGPSIPIPRLSGTFAQGV